MSKVSGARSSAVNGDKRSDQPARVVAVSQLKQKRENAETKRAVVDAVPSDGDSDSEYAEEMDIDAADSEDASRNVSRKRAAPSHSDHDDDATDRPTQAAKRVSFAAAPLVAGDDESDSESADGDGDIADNANDLDDDDGGDDDEHVDQQDDDDDGDQTRDTDRDAMDATATDEQHSATQDTADSGGNDGTVRRKVVKPMTTKKLQEYRQRAARRGVVYVARVPPFMRPIKLKQLLSEYGEITRIFLTPEDASQARKRKRQGGNRGKKFTDGWVEFADKSIAKAVAASLNNTQVGGSHRSRYHDDIWNIRYLSGFKWEHLSEKIAHARAVRDQKIRNDMSAAKKETKFYLSKVEQAKAVRAIEQRKTGTGGSGSTSGSTAQKQNGDSDRKTAPKSTGDDEVESGRPRKVLRTFKQREAVEMSIPDTMSKHSAPSDNGSSSFKDRNSLARPFPRGPSQPSGSNGTDRSAGSEAGLSDSLLRKLFKVKS